MLWWWWWCWWSPFISSFLSFFDSSPFTPFIRIYHRRRVHFLSSNIRFSTAAAAAVQGLKMVFSPLFYQDEGFRLRIVLLRRRHYLHWTVCTSQTVQYVGVCFVFLYSTLANCVLAWWPVCFVLSLICVVLAGDNYGHNGGGGNRIWGSLLRRVERIAGWLVECLNVGSVGHRLIQPSSILSGSFHGNYGDRFLSQSSAVPLPSGTILCVLR